jgi:PEP-CTERM motif
MIALSGDINMRTALFVISTVSALALAAPANAAVVLTAADAGTNFQVNYTGLVGGVVTNLISAVQDFTLVSVTNMGTTYNFNHRTENTSTNSALFRSYGFDIGGATISSFSATGSLRHGSTSTTNYPEGGGHREICFAFSSAGSCASANNGGIAPGAAEAGNGSFSITFDTSPVSIILDNFIARAHTINPQINGNVNGLMIGATGMAGGVPEPATWAMMILGFGFAGAAMRRAKVRTRIAYS